MSRHDNVLIQQVIAGDQTAYEQLYMQYSARVYAICLRLLANRAKAEEATQETFIRIWQQLTNFRADSQFSTWVHRVAVNTAIDSWRQDKFARLMDEADLEIIADPAQELQLLDKLILKLPKQARAVFVLFAIEGYQHQEIAQLLQIAEGSSKAQYHRARQLLQEWLNAAE